jgi:hypothetical protein
MWGKGELKSTQVQRLARSASQQQALGVGRLAQNSSPKHACRDLQRALGWPPGCPDFEWIDLPVGDDVSGGFMHPHPIICPISMLEKALSHDEDRFRRLCAGDPAENAAYWYNMRNHVTYTRIQQYIDPQHTQPVSVHGDGAPTNKTDGIFTIQWSIDTVAGTTLEKTNIFTVVQKQFLRAGHLDKLFDRFAWSFNALLTGIIPERDWRGHLHPRRGQKIQTGKNNYACGRLRGDWEFYVDVMNFQRWDAPNCCWVCDATMFEGCRCWTRVNADAGWRPTIRSHETYVAGLRALGIEPPQLFKILSMFFEGVTIDSLHAVDQGRTFFST